MREYYSTMPYAGEIRFLNTLEEILEHKQAVIEATDICGETRPKGGDNNSGLIKLKEWISSPHSAFNKEYCGRIDCRIEMFIMINQLVAEDKWANKPTECSTVA